MLVGLPDVDEDGAGLDQLLGFGGRDVGKGHVNSTVIVSG
jgi:hypothetical protein